MYKVGGLAAAFGAGLSWSHGWTAMVVWFFVGMLFLVALDTFKLDDKEW